MSANRFLLEIMKGGWLLDASNINAYLPLVEKILTGQKVYEKQPIEAVSRSLTPSENSKQKFGIISMIGALTRYGEDCSYGTEDYAQMMYEAQKSSDGLVIKIDGPGGSVSAMSPILEFANQKSKPIAVVVGSAASGCYWAAVKLADRIFMENEIISQVGSVGVMFTFADLTNKFKNEGIEVHEVYADESQHKNEAFRLVLEGKYDQIKKEYLSPLAKAFQNDVRSSRPNLKEETGVLTGKMFFAKEAIKYGMADAVGTIKDAVNYLEIRNELNY